MASAERVMLYAPNRAGLYALLVEDTWGVWTDAYCAAGHASWNRDWCAQNLGFLVLAVNDAARILGAAKQAYSDVAPPPWSADLASVPPYMDPSHPRYAPKLAAAVRAWLAVDEQTGKTPKQALAKWLRDHAEDFELLGAEGKPNEQGIEECAKVANWRTDGGAPKTPGGYPPTHSSPNSPTHSGRS